MTPANLQQWILHPETLNKETLYDLRTSLVRYPYCQTLRLLYLKNLYLLHDINFGPELRKSALYVSDRRVLFYLVEGDKYTLSPKKKKDDGAKEVETDSGADRTISLIDAFLSFTPNDTPTQTGLDYATDYTSYLLKEEDESIEKEVMIEGQSKLRGQNLIDDFIEKSEEAIMRLQSAEEDEEKTFVGPDTNSQEEDDADTFFTETLAQIYIKQRRYSKALEIIKKLSLKYPKKNSYFADQIRFLEKLIINANSE